MKFFADYLTERVKLRSRKEMPQIDKMDKFIDDIKINGHTLTSDEVDPKTLKPTQHEFNMDKVKGMIKDNVYRDKPIVTTKDGYILDGHHRWKACMEEEQQQPIIRVNMKFDDLYDFVDGKDYVKYKQIHEAAKQVTEWNFNSNMSMSDYMTDEEKQEKQDKRKKQVDDIYTNFFTNEAFEQIRKSLKEDGGAAFGLGGNAGDGGTPSNGNGAETVAGDDFESIKNKPNSTTNVSMPSTMIDPLRRRRHNIDDDADIASTGGDDD